MRTTFGLFGIRVGSRLPRAITSLPARAIDLAGAERVDLFLDDLVLSRMIEDAGLSIGLWRPDVAHLAFNPLADVLVKLALHFDDRLARRTVGEWLRLHEILLDVRLTQYLRRQPPHRFDLVQYVKQLMP